jgi:hypothetical protein
MNPRLLLLLLPVLVLGCPKKTDGAATSGGAAAAEPATPAGDGKADARAVWDEMVARSDAFDPTVFDLYSSDAVLREKRTARSGAVTERSFLVAAFRPMAARIMEAAKLTDDKATYSEIAMEPDGERWKVSAKRYAKVKCITDDDYYAILARDSRGAFKIVEEYQVSFTVSQCPRDPAEARRLITDLDAGMAGRLPLDVSAGVRMDAVEVDDLLLTYRQTLTDVPSTHPDLEPMKAQLYADVRRQSCGLPDLKQILHHGGSVRFVLSTSDAKKAIEVTTAEADCD